jgi:hypothetical protein
MPPPIIISSKDIHTLIIDQSDLQEPSELIEANP